MRIQPSDISDFIRRPGWLKTTLNTGNGTCDTSSRSSLPTCSTCLVLHINRGQKKKNPAKTATLEVRGEHKSLQAPLAEKAAPRQTTAPVLSTHPAGTLKSLFHSAIPLFYISHRSCGQVLRSGPDHL